MKIKDDPYLLRDTLNMATSKQSRLALEIQQNKPFQSAEQALYISILKTASELALSTDRFLRAYGITHIQYNVLRILQGAGPDGLGRNKIAERMITTAPDMTRLLDRMASQGLVVRTRDREDKRQVATTITPAGKALLARVEGPLMKLHTAQFAKLNKMAMKTAIECLSNVREAAV